VHTAEKNVVRTAEKYGVAAGSVPTITDLKTRRAGPRKAIRTGLAVFDSRIHNLLNENRFDINLDGSNTPHRVDKKNKCVWMYEGTAEEMIIPLSYERDALYIDYRPLTAEEQVQFVRANPLSMEDWSLGESQHHLREPIREVLEEVQRQECEVEEQHECNAPEATEEQQRQATAPARTKRDQRTPIDELVRGVSHDTLCHALRRRHTRRGHHATGN
jgi:hypothetical protein